MLLKSDFKFDYFSAVNVPERRKCFLRILPQLKSFLVISLQICEKKLNTLEP